MNRDTSPLPELLTVDEAYERLGGAISRRTLYRLAKASPLAAVQVGRRVYLRADWLAALVNPAPPPDPPEPAPARRGTKKAGARNGAGPKRYFDFPMD